MALLLVCLKMNSTRVTEAIYGDNKPEEVDVSEHLNQLEQSVEQSPDFKDITDPEHDTILGELNQLMQQPQITYDQKFELKKLKRDVLLNLQKRQTVFKDIDNLGGIGEANHYLRDMLRKIESSQLQSAKRSIGAVQNQIRELGLSRTVRDGSLDREVVAGFYKLSGQKPTIEPSEAAMRLAEIMRAPADYYRVRLNNNGSNIGKAEDYIAHTEHDRHKMRNFYWYFKSPQKAFNMWANDELPLWSEKTFDGVVPGAGETETDAKRMFAYSVYKALLTGVHKSYNAMFGMGPSDFIPAAFEGTRNYARRLSQSRVIMYKDDDAWFKHFENYASSKNIAEATFRNILQSSRALYLMQKLGTNPEGNLNWIIKKLQEKYRDADLKDLDSFSNNVPMIKKMLNQLTGVANLPDTERRWQVARWMSAARMWETTTMLGGVGVTHGVSAPITTGPTELTHHGFNRFSGMANLARELAMGTVGEERKDAMAVLGAFADGWNSELISRWNPDDPIPGAMSVLTSAFLKATGIHFIMNMNMAGHEFVVAHRLAQNLGKNYEDMIKEHKPLPEYQLKKDDWQLLQKYEHELTDNSGVKYLLPDLPDRISDDDIRDLLISRKVGNHNSAPDFFDKKIKEYRWDLSDKLGAYYNDVARYSVVQPDVETKARVLGDTKRGSAGGEALRFFMQFKMWPVAAYYQTMARTFYYNSTKLGKFSAFGMLIGMSAISGYMRMFVNDELHGREPRDPTDIKTILAAVWQGGGLGIYGDFLFGETSRFGSGILSTAAGPVLSDIAKLYDMREKFEKEISSHDPNTRGKAWDHLWPNLMRWGIDHTPFVNLIYLKGTLDYMALYHIYEEMSPGWWERTNRKMQKDEGRTMVGYKPGRGIPYGIPGVTIRQ
jgi:hypothetical protein